MTKVVVIGAGPAGLLAAYAIERMGHEPVIIAPKEQSKISKVQCLWKEIPGLGFSSYELLVGKRGTREVYNARLYGSPSAASSWDAVEAGSYPVWPLDKVYDALWQRFEGSIMDKKINEEQIPLLLENYPVVLNTAPARTFCQDRMNHEFNFVNTQILKIENEREALAAITIMNGDPARHTGENWYRYTCIRGEEVWEYADHQERRGVSLGLKPMSTSCDCWTDWAGWSRPRQLHRIGRFGKWEQGVMNHHAFFDTVALLSTEGLGRERT